MFFLRRPGEFGGVRWVFPVSFGRGRAVVRHLVSPFVRAGRGRAAAIGLVPPPPLIRRGRGILFPNAGFCGVGAVPQVESRPFLDGRWRAFRRASLLVGVASDSDFSESD